MGKSKKEKLFSKILLALMLTVLVSLFSITFAWFTDKKEYEGTLNFGSIELDVSGGVVNETQTLNFQITRVGNSGKVMPGDTVNINLTLGLKSTSEPAYYIVYIFDNNGVFEESMYFSEDGTNVYVNNFTKTYLQSDANKASVSGKYCGKLTNESAQNITISAKVSEDYEIQGTNVKVFCKIYAIQQANLTSQQAYDELYPRVNFVTSANWKAAIPDYVNLTSIGFYDKKDSGLTGYAKDDTLTTNLNAKLSANDQEKLEVWKKTDTDIAFVSDKVIMAPENCTYLFSDSTAANRLTNLTTITFNNFNTSLVLYMNGMFLGCQVLTSLDLSGFNSSKVIDMNSMFSGCNALTSLYVSNFNTSKLTITAYMFTNCRGLTSLDVSNFNTSKVTNMSSMFDSCIALTSLDVSNFNTSKVTNMSSMFANCGSLTSLDVTNFNTNNVTNMYSMFYSCNKLTSLDVTNFNTNNVTNMGGMFQGCIGLTSLDLSNFNTNNVTNMYSMFNGCSGLKSLNVSNFATSKVQSMYAMFFNCSALTSLDVSSFTTSNVTSMSSMFGWCSKLTSLDLSSFNTSSVTTWTNMFNNTFSNAPSSSSLKISSNFTYKVGEVNTQFASKTELNTQTSLNTSVTVLKDGNALS